MVLVAVIGCWAVAVTAGLWSLWRHSLTPGQAAHAMVSWPAESKLPREAGRATLVMTLHPQCPCSRASVTELEVLMSRCPGKLTVYVLFAESAGSNIPIESTPLWKSAGQIPGVKTVVDKGGELTRCFDGQTSGQVFVYDSQGVLQFSGGLTASRGHEGDNDGLTAVEAIVNSVVPVVRTTPVYGCSIW